ncbi:hypothetical protein B0H13DRAFT_2658052 [Mycena leptocephala]|nr:hypothetical protein B0H13DRAFT_2658052 [Mycena leptocephala]
MKAAANMEACIAKLVLLGARGAGKTALMERFTQNYFTGGCYGSDLETSWRKMMLVDEHMWRIEVELIREYDADPVSSAWRKYHEESIQNGEAFLLIYFVASRTTFDRLVEFRERAMRGKPTIPPMIHWGQRARHTDLKVFIGMCLYLHVTFVGLQMCPDIVFVNVQPYPCIVFARVQPHLHTSFVGPLTHPHVAIVGLLSRPQVAFIAGGSQAVDSRASPPVKSAQQQHPS